MNNTTVAFLTKLKKLEQQLTIARLSDFSYPDARDALNILRTRVKKKRIQVEESERFSTGTRNAILRDVNFLIVRLTAIAGIITRSASVRNAFELYAPFLEICKSLVGNDARLVLSSEWEYVPFTYPQNLAELPEFIVIGLPASESDNVLIFPAAGHELGHSVWSKHGLADKFKPRIEGHVSDALRRNLQEFEAVFPDVKGADLDQDMFVQYIKSSIVYSVNRQAEETFADFIGLLLFGEGYLCAFEYLIAPQIVGARSKEYPETQERAATLQKFANDKLGVARDGYSNSFSVDTPFRLPHDTFICSIADQVVRELHEEIYSSANGIVTHSGINLPSADGTAAVLGAFIRGVPYDDSVALGDLINAAWHVFHSGEQENHRQQGHGFADFISDLVLKSAEIHEISRLLK